MACADCGQEFTFTAGEQEFYAQRGFTESPKRCPSCRQIRKAQRSRGSDSGSSRDGGYSGGYGDSSYASGGSNGGGYSSSGDIVSVKNGGTFLTVTGPSCGDCLLQVDPKTGNIVKNYGTVNHSSVFGLAFWAGALYGFDDAGELFEITANGNGIKTTPIVVQGGLQFWGAGSTTSAPATDKDGGGIIIN